MTNHSFSGVPSFQVHLADGRFQQIEQFEYKQVEIALFGEDRSCTSQEQAEDACLDRHVREFGLNVSCEPYVGSHLEHQLLDAVTTLASTFVGHFPLSRR